MTPEKQKQYEERLDRIKKAVRLEEADRVPFAPKIGGFYASGYGLNMYDMMKDLRTAEPGFRKYLADYEPDLVWPVVTYPIDPVERLDATYIRVPGPGSGLPLNSSFQFLDNCYMEDDEFGEFLLDPTHFMLTKVLPRKYRKLKGFEKLYFREIYDQSGLMEMAKFGEDDIRKSLYAMIQAGEFCVQSKEQSKYMANVVNECGYPLRGGTIVVPFDAYADSLRGLIQSVIDIKERPEETLEVVNRIADLNVDRQIAAAKARGDIFTFMPLHAGVDEFMSPADYEKFYLPGLMRVINGLVDAGIIPYVFCEGKYNTRLEMLTDVPKGKVIYMFEEVDIKRAKDTVGKVACICGNLPSASLAFGKPEKIEEETKRMLDICAPGGGFIMDCSIILDNADHQNMRAWKEATLKYGQY